MKTAHATRAAVVALTAAAAAGLSPAGPAAADTAGYLRELGPRYAFLTSDQLLRAGQVVCAASGRGIPSSDTVATLQRDFGITVPAAADIIATANTELGC